MSAASIKIALARLQTEEGRRTFAYNDATGKRVSCQPGGNLSIGVGINLETGLDDTEIDFLICHRLTLVDEKLMTLWWAQGIDDNRMSVFDDLGYNAGITSLLHFPKMMAAAGAKDWLTCAGELLDSDAARELPSRYDPLSNILRSGQL